MKGRTVLGVLLALLVVAAASAVLLDVWERPGRDDRLRLENVDVSAESVRPETVDLEVQARFNRPASVENGSLEVAVNDASTGLLVYEKDVGIPGEGESGLSEVRTDLTLERSRDYDLTFRLKSEGRVEGIERLRLRGLSSLRPPESELEVELKDVDFQVLGTDANVTRVESVLYLDAARSYGDARLHVKAVQHESNLLADSRWVNNVSLEAGQTERVSTELSVPAGYNYVVEVEAWRGGSLSRVWKHPLNLNPTREVPRNLSVEQVPFRVEAFTEEGRDDAPGPMPTPEPDRSLPGEGGAAPGPGATLAILGLIGTSLVLWRTKN